MNWTTLLQDLQAYFIKRLQSNAAILHQINNPDLTGYHSEITLISKKELEHIEKSGYRGDLENQPKNLPENGNGQLFYCLLGKWAVIKYLDNLVPDVEKIEHDRNRPCILNLSSGLKIGIVVKTQPESWDTLKWSVSSEGVDDFAALVFILIQKCVNSFSEYQIVLAGFIPPNMIQPIDREKRQIGIEELLYSGGLKTYLNSAKKPEKVFNAIEKNIESISELENHFIWGYNSNTIKAHSDEIYSVIFSPDGQYIASGSKDTEIKIWHLATQTNIHTLQGHSDDVYSVIFSGDGKTLASGSRDGTIKIWHVETGKLLNTFEGKTDAIFSLYFAPDGKTLVSGGVDKRIDIWEIDTERLLGSLAGHSNYVNSIAIAPDGQTIVSGSGDNTIKIWDLKTRKLRTTIEDSTPVYSVAIAPDGQTIASGGLDKIIKIWNMDTGIMIHTLAGHSEAVSAVAIAPDSQMLMSSSNDKTLKIWHLQTGKLIRSLDAHSQAVHCVAIAPNGQTIVTGSGDGTLKIWRRD